MPEETNRVLADHCSIYLFAPTPKSKEILLHEGIGEKQVFMVGNTIVDAVYQNLDLAKSKTQILDQLNLKANKYILATTHRQENADDPAKLKRMLQAIQKTEMPIIFPIHPRTKKAKRKRHLPERHKHPTNRPSRLHRNASVT